MATVASAPWYSPIGATDPREISPPAQAGAQAGVAGTHADVQREIKKRLDSAQFGAAMKSLGDLMPMGSEQSESLGGFNPLSMIVASMPGMGANSAGMQNLKALQALSRRDDDQGDEEDDSDE